jgi:hypothetical protein
LPTAAIETARRSPSSSNRNHAQAGAHLRLPGADTADTEGANRHPQADRKTDSATTTDRNPPTRSFHVALSSFTFQQQINYFHTPILLHLVIDDAPSVRNLALVVLGKGVVACAGCPWSQSIDRCWTPCASLRRTDRSWTPFHIASLYRQILNTLCKGAPRVKA